MSNFPTPGTYVIDKYHSNVTFIVRHLVVSKVRGNFSDFEGVITVGESPEASSVIATVQAATISTNNETRDNHIRSSDFLDLENHPTLNFTSSELSAKGGNEYALTGDLTIRGVTKTVTFDLEFTGQGETFTPGVSVVGFEAKTEIDRRDFGVNFEGNLENGAAVVSHNIVIELSIEAALQA